MRNVPSAYWIDVKRKLSGNTTNDLEGILADSAAKENPPLVVLIVYDLRVKQTRASIDSL